MVVLYLVLVLVLGFLEMKNEALLQNDSARIKNLRD